MHAKVGRIETRIHFESSLKVVFLAGHVPPRPHHLGWNHFLLNVRSASSSSDFFFYIPTSVFVSLPRLSPPSCFYREPQILLAFLAGRFLTSRLLPPLFFFFSHPTLRYISISRGYMCACHYLTAKVAASSPSSPPGDHSFFSSLSTLPLPLPSSYISSLPTLLISPLLSSTSLLFLRGCESPPPTEMYRQHSLK